MAPTKRIPTTVGSPRFFALDNANIAGAEMARRFEVDLHGIVQRARKSDPVVDVVHKARVERRWPR